MSNKKTFAPTDSKKIKFSREFIMLAFAAFIFRIILGIIYRGFGVDISCFMGWSSAVYEHGFGEFYNLEIFTDYPPGYMYVLWVIGWIRDIFNMTSDTAIVLLLKLPSIICDILMGGIIYRIAREKATEFKSLFASVLFMFNPAIFINSSLYAQVDAVLGILVLLTVYFIYKKKLIPSYFTFCIGFLVKPQMAFIAPVLLLAIIEQVFLHRDYKNYEERKKFWKDFFINLGSGLLAIGSLVLLAYPFGLETVFNQYTETIESYPYVSVNAYNFWTMLGQNWVFQDTEMLGLPMKTWGTIFICAVFALVFVYWLISIIRKQKDTSKYFFMGALSIIGICTMSVRMHERYMFPAIALLLAFAVLRPSVESFSLYGIMSVIHFANVSHILFWYPKSGYDWSAAGAFDWNDTESIIIGALATFAFAFMLFLGKVFLDKSEKTLAGWHSPKKKKSVSNQPAGTKEIPVASGKKKKGLFVSKPLAKIVKTDIIIMLVVTVIYAAIALFNLGNTEGPQSGWTSSVANEQYVFEFEEPVEIKKVWYFLGYYNDPYFDFEVLDESGQWIKVVDNEQLGGVFKWQEKTFSQTYSTTAVRMTSLSQQASIWELTFVDSEGNYVTPSNPEVCPWLFDETDVIPDRISYMNSTYFDEIYHARTAYEFTIGEHTYEWSHPPLGKIFIMFGVMLFGMVPFGWRIAGTVFGIIMLPCIYVWAKKLFSKTWIATVAILLFAFDFMHFAQTRIATIDTFVTLFIILMFLFMYSYINRSYYDRKFSSVLLPLALSGMFMGLGVASKWTGAYAGCGLAVVFFWDLFRRYREYRYALAHPEGITNGIAHKQVIEMFPKRTIQILLSCVVFFIVIPAIIYLLSYIPFVSYNGDSYLDKVIQNQISMYTYHADLISEHPFSSKWYEWPIIVRPIYYYSYIGEGMIREAISSFGNPLVWWAGIPAFFYMLYVGIKHNDRVAGFLTVGYLAQFLPWMLVERTTYIYHYFPSVPFVILMICYAFKRFVKKSKTRKRMVFVYVAAVIVLFIMFYPVLSGYPVSKKYVFSYLKWFEKWVLIS